MKKLAKKLTKEWLKWKYGPRCDDFTSGCVVCDKWNCFDGLFGKRDPFTLEQEIKELEKDLKWKKHHNFWKLVYIYEESLWLYSISFSYRYQ